MINKCKNSKLSWAATQRLTSMIHLKGNSLLEYILINNNLRFLFCLF